MTAERQRGRRDVARGRTVRKRCGRCGEVGWYRPREGHCRQLGRNAMGRTGFLCWGALARVPPTAVGDEDLRLPDGLGLGAVLDEGVQERMQRDRGERMRADARRKLERARAKVIEWSLAVARAGQRLRKWQVEADRQARRAALTDAQVAADVERRQAARTRRAQRRRAVAPGGELKP